MDFEKVPALCLGKHMDDNEGNTYCPPTCPLHQLCVASALLGRDMIGNVRDQFSTPGEPIDPATLAEVMKSVRSNAFYTDRLETGRVIGQEIEARKHECLPNSPSNN